jgi:hypothetical protein
MYLEPGVGQVTRSGTYGALQLDGGHRLGDSSLWLHGRLAHGGMIGIDWTTKNSDFTEARVGLEARGCALSGIACLVVGADVGYRHEMVMRASGIQRNDLAPPSAVGFPDLGVYRAAQASGGVGPRRLGRPRSATGVAYAWEMALRRH